MQALSEQVLVGFLGGEAVERAGAVIRTRWKSAIGTQWPDIRAIMEMDSYGYSGNCDNDIFVGDLPAKGDNNPL